VLCFGELTVQRVDISDSNNFAILVRESGDGWLAWVNRVDCAVMHNRYPGKRLGFLKRCWLRFSWLLLGCLALFTASDKQE
jgi:hypothetical protein